MSSTKEYLARYYAIHREEIRSKQKKYYQDNKNRIVEERRAYTALHREEKNRYHRKYYAIHKDQECEKARVRIRLLKDEILNHYGTRCECCDENNKEFLCIDHVNGGGKKHREEVGGNFYRWLKKSGYPQEGYRVLCHNCNMSLGLYGYCPHSLKEGA